MDSREVTWDSAQARALIACGDVGGAIRLARRGRGWRQADLGRASGYSASTISRLETGRRASADVYLLRRVGTAAGIPAGVLGALLGLPGLSPATVARATGRWAEEDDPMRRRSVLAAAGVSVPAVLLSRFEDALVEVPGTRGHAGAAEEVARRLARARSQFDNGDLARLIGDMPRLLAAGHEAAGKGGEGGYALLAACYDMATRALSKVGGYQASRITADRAIICAGFSGSPVAAASAARSLGIVLRHEGHHEMAKRVTLEAASRLEATGLRRPAEAAAYAQMLCTCGYNAAQAADRDRALELIRDAERAVRQVPAEVVRSQFVAMTPAQVALYRVGIHWALGDAGSAVNVGVRLHSGQFATRERRARLHTDMARAWWQWGKPEQTAMALAAAYREAPGEVRQRPRIRKIVTELAERHPRVSGVRELAHAVTRREHT